MGHRDVTGQSKTILAAVAVVAVVSVAMGALDAVEDYIRTRIMGGTVPLVFDDLPAWVDDGLRNQVTLAAGGHDFPVNERTAGQVAQNLKAVAWIDGPSVRVTYAAVHVRGRWRRPVALIESEINAFYVDANLVALDYTPLTRLTFVTVRGVRLSGLPVPGQVVAGTEVKTAVELLVLLDRMDRRLVPHRPLLSQIEAMDLTNFEGRLKPHSPHIVLVAKDGTQILWGARTGEWGRHLEARDEEKLARLYDYYKQSNYVLGQVRYVDLTRPQGQVPLPEDKYRQDNR